VAVVGIVLTLAYLFKMMRGLFYGPMDQKYSHAHDAVALADRLPLLIMITVSIGFFFFPMHLYNVVRSGVDPLIAKITRVVPVASQERETTSPSGSSDAPVLAINPLPLTPHPSRRSD
jgi:NADH-quinone oxidoreductase subunit M